MKAHHVAGWLMVGALLLGGCGGEGGGGGNGNGNGNERGSIPATLQFSTTAHSAGEAGGSVGLTVTRSGDSGGTASVVCSTGVLTATPNVDYADNAVTLHWAAGDATAKTCPVVLLDDKVQEVDEALLVTLSGALGASVGSPSSVTLTIRDDDAPVESPGTLQFSTSGYSVGEAGGSATITVTRNGGAAGEVSVGYSTADGTASSGLDYTAVAGTLTWAAGETAAQSFGVTILEDAVAEPAESVVLTLSGAIGATLGSPSSAELTIGDNDAVATGVTLRGEIHPADHARVDGDTNDPNMPYAANDDFASAQPIPNPVTLAGYVNVAGFGPNGRSWALGDVSDYYRVSLIAGQTIGLRIASPDQADLDLYLYDGSGTVVDASLGTGKDESLVVGASGDYFVEVYVYEVDPGASGYVLAVGLTPASTVPRSSRLSDAMVPGEVVVRFQDAVLPASGGDPLEARGAVLGLAAKAGAVGRESLLALGGEADRVGTFGALGVSYDGSRAELFSAAPEFRERWDIIRVVKALRKRFDVAYAEPNYLLQPLTTTPNDPYYGYQWHYPLLNLPQAWDVTTGQQNGVVVAVIDTGVLFGHPDLQGQLLDDGYDFISDLSVAVDGDGIDPDAADPGDANRPGEGSSFHGTHVAGTIAARSNNATGVAGVSWAAKILPIRVLGRGGGTSYDILQGVRYAAGLGNDSGTVPARRADVMNLSLGGGAPSAIAQSVYTQAREAGVLIIAAAGNTGASGLQYPASYTGVVSVSSVDLLKQLAPYSTYGPRVDVAAPGGDTSRDRNGDGYADGVLSTWANDSQGSPQLTYAFMQGTSMASPHMAGVVALMKAVNPDLTPDQLDALLVGGSITEDLGVVGRDDRYGHGLIDAHMAVVAAQGTSTPSAPILVASPASLNLGTDATSGQFTLSNAGNGDLTLTSLSSNQGWAIVPPAAGLGSYTVTVDRSGLVEGTHTADITAVSNANTVTVTVILQVAAAGGDTGGDAGFHYVLLRNPVTQEALRQVAVGAAGGIYPYAFTTVPAGEYQIWGGTDLNNDGVICSDGEACGAYLTVTNPTNVRADRDRAELDFGTGFELILTSPAAADAEAPRTDGLRLPSTKGMAR
ncbi:MAG: S8 family serine peptidase [Deferrisomatales bacterium]|nr:S8 family serine peptidase [Deferrisomatales bacterium]